MSRKKLNILLLPAIMTAIFGLASCSSSGGTGGTGGGDAGDGSGDTTAPEVSSSSPADNATGVAVNANLSITFNEIIDTSSVTVNSSDTTCSGSIQVSSDSFSSCVQMSGAATASDSDKTFSLDPATALSASTDYEIKLSGIKDTAGNTMADVEISFTTGAGSDTTAPSWENSTPATANLAATSVDLNVQIDEDGTVYYVIIGDGETVPDASQVKAGLDYGAVTVVKSGNSSVTGSLQHTFNITGLTASTAYDIYAVAEDGSNNLQSSPATKIDITTSAAPDTTAPTWENSTPATANLAATSVDLNVKIDEDGTVYYIVIGDGETAPDASEVKAGSDYGSVTVVKSDNSSVTGSSQHTFDITGLTASTAYDIYAVAEDSSNNLQSSPATKIDITTQAAAGGLNAGDLVITEVMANPSGTEGDQEYIEIYNASGAAIDFSTNNIEINDGGASPDTINSGTLAAGEYYLLCANTNSGQNGGITVCDATLGFGLTNGGETLTVKEGSTTIDSFTYDDDAGNGYAWELKPGKLSALDNDTFPGNWQVALFPFGGSGTDDWGTPGEANSEPILISEILVKDGGDDDYEFIELYNPNSVAINLKDAGYRIERDSSGGGGPGILCRFDDAGDFKNDSLPGNLEIPAHGFYLIANENYTGITPTPDAWVKDGSGAMIITNSNTIYVGKGPISDKNDEDILDFVGFGSAADYDGTGAAPDLNTDGHSIERKAFSNSTADSDGTTGMFSGGGHADKGNGYDTDDNSADFILRTTADPQNSSSSTETP